MAIDKVVVVGIFYFGDMNEQYIQAHRQAKQLDIPGQFDLQVTLVS